MTGLVLWGDTSEAVWRPRSPRMTLVRDPAGLSQLTVARVWAEVQRLFAGQVVLANRDI